MTVAGRERGQATVELALLLPLLVTLLLGVIQVGLVVRSSVAVTHATRAAARAVVVDPSTAAARAAARRSTSLASTSLTVTVSGDRRSGGWVSVQVSYRDPTDVPLIGRLLPTVTLSDRLVVRVE